MNCNNSREAWRRVSKCANKDKGKQGTEMNHDAAWESTTKRKTSASIPKKKSSKELKRQKLTVRRPIKGIKINKSQTQSS